jgi:hypothetical protein
MTELQHDPDDNRPVMGKRFAWGTTVAWMRQNKKYEWSSVHRSFDGYMTFCSRTIPASCDVSAIGSGRPAMGKCSRCETLFKRAAAYREREILSSGR